MLKSQNTYHPYYNYHSTFVLHKLVLMTQTYSMKQVKIMKKIIGHDLGLWSKHKDICQ